MFPEAVYAGVGPGLASGRHAVGSAEIDSLAGWRLGLAGRARTVSWPSPDLTSSVASGNDICCSCFRIFALSCCTWSTIVRWRPSSSAAVVTQLVTHLQAGDRVGVLAPVRHCSRLCTMPAIVVTEGMRPNGLYSVSNLWQTKRSLRMLTSKRA